MSITTRYARTLATIVFLLATSMLSTSALAGIQIPGSSIPESGSPIFVNEVSIRANKGKWTITSKDGFSFFDGTTNWTGDNGNMLLKANFDNAGNLVSGSMRLRGKIAGLTSGSGAVLLTSADLISFDFDSLYNNKLIGFGTDNIYCSSQLGVTCTTSESIWIQLDSVYGDDPNLKFKTSGTAYTTVPVPAAVWLFGSGLGFLGAAVKTRRKKIA